MRKWKYDVEKKNGAKFRVNLRQEELQIEILYYTKKSDEIRICINFS